MKWNQTLASKCKWSMYTEEMFKNWDIIWDHSTAAGSTGSNHQAEFVATKDGQIAYMRYTYPLNRDRLEKMTDDERRRTISLKVELFNDTSDFRSWVEHKNDNRLRKLVV